MFYPHNFFEQFLGVEVCSRETLNVLCKNALFAITGADNKNFNMVCMPWNFWLFWATLLISCLIIMVLYWNQESLQNSVQYADKRKRNHKPWLLVLLPPGSFHHLIVPWSKQLVEKTNTENSLLTSDHLKITVTLISVRWGIEPCCQVPL